MNSVNKIRLLIVSVFLLVFVIAFSFSKSFSYAEEAAVYTYKVVPLSQAKGWLESILNKYGSDGWKLVEIDDGTGNIIFRK
ncbi:MAG: DUF4177 domain-containing protein [Candidatus Aureabacteria bacterium]|nr:DUF4177 domain-containing protein [Candidatus Auribacterota bacterium]